MYFTAVAPAYLSFQFPQCSSEIFYFRCLQLGTSISRRHFFLRPFKNI